MPNYLMFDHGGVLDGRISMSTSDNDLILEEFDWGGFQVIPNGVEFVRDLNELVDEYGYHVVFHSKNSQADQLLVLRQLMAACEQKGISFPVVKAMAVRDPDAYAGVPSHDCTIEINTEYGISIAGYDTDGCQNGKACARQALSKLLAISPEDRANHIVFDDGPTVAPKAREEGYFAYLIGDGSESLGGAISLTDAVQAVLAQEKSLERAEEYQAYPTCYRAEAKTKTNPVSLTDHAHSVLVEENTLGLNMHTLGVAMKVLGVAAVAFGVIAVCVASIGSLNFVAGGVTASIGLGAFIGGFFVNYSKETEDVCINSASYPVI